MDHGSQANWRSERWGGEVPAQLAAARPEMEKGIDREKVDPVSGLEATDTWPPIRRM
jgi:hypothetical protein